MDEKGAEEVIMDTRNYTNPFVTIMHPFDASYDIRFKNKGSWSISCVILALMFFASVFSRQNTSYIFNYNKLSDFNVLLQMLGVALPFGLFVISNWIVGILLSGTGRFRDIFIYTSYCMVPFVIGRCHTSVVQAIVKMIGLIAAQFLGEIMLLLLVQ